MDTRILSLSRLVLNGDTWHFTVRDQPLFTIYYNRDFITIALFANVRPAYRQAESRNYILQSLPTNGDHCRLIRQSATLGWICQF